MLPLWRAKEPAIDFFLGKRFALPLFFERSLIEITPRRCSGGRTGTLSRRRAWRRRRALGMDSDLFAKLSAYPHVVVCWIDDDGYPVQTRRPVRADAGRGEVRIGPTGLPLPDDREVNVVASHIRPQPGNGYDQRRYISLWGRLHRDGERWSCGPGARGDGTKRRRRSSSTSSVRTTRRRRYLQRSRWSGATR